MHELIDTTAAASVVIQERIELVYRAWLAAKANRTHSAWTERAYRETLTGFRAELHALGLDLDSDPRAVALAAQVWADRGNAANATYNRRLAIVSSFYRYGRDQGLLDIPNPIERVERRPITQYESSQGLDRDAIRAALGAIDRETLPGARDYALLRVGLTTFRRAAELAGLRCGDIAISGELVTLTWKHTKGGKVMRDTLPAAVGRELLTYLHLVYRAGLDGLQATAPVWVSFARNGTAGQAISVEAIRDICIKHFGTAKIHALRHTGARAMEDAGAKVSAIQARLGHSSLATTGKYLAALRAHENPYGDAVAAMFEP